MIDPDLVAPCDYQAIPTHWAKALSKSKLKCITKMVVINYPSLRPYHPELIESLSECLKTATEGVFARNSDPSLVPQLTLQGLGDKEWKKFPQRWEVKNAMAVLGPDVVVETSTFGSSVLASDHGNFGFLPDQDEDGV
jgi:hypothetical protein